MRTFRRNLLKGSVAFAGCLVVLMLLAGNAGAALFFDYSGTYNKVNPLDGTSPAAASATFQLTSDGFSVKLENLLNPTAEIGSAISGIMFTSNATGITLTGAAAAGSVNLATNVVTGPLSETDPTPLQWTYSSGFLHPLGTGNQTNALKPYGIVNATYTTADGMTNTNHNPWLIGPVTFYFTATTGENFDVSALSFYFNTDGSNVTGVPHTTGGQVPIPPTALLLASGVVGLIAVRRRFRK